MAVLRPRLETPDGRRPVLLVPGWSDRSRVLRRLRDRFVAAGWAAEAVAIVEFGDRFGSNIEHADEVGRSARALLDRTAAETLDVVAHSMGGLAVRRYIGDDPRHAIRHVVFVATPHTGTWAALLSWGGARREMLPGSEFLRRLPPPGVPCTTIRTLLDLRIFPGFSACLPGAPDVNVRRASHQGLLRSRAAFDAILAALAVPAPAWDVSRSPSTNGGAGRTAQSHSRTC